MVVLGKGRYDSSRRLGQGKQRKATGIMTRRLDDSLASLCVPRLAASGTRWAFGTSGSPPRILWLPMCEAGDWIVHFVGAAELTGGEAKLTMCRGETRKAS